MLFSNALVRTPGHSVIDGIDDYANLGQTDYPTALAQHQAYVALLKDRGVTVTVLDPLEAFPDSCFVEDPTVVAADFAVITNPARASRTPERGFIRPALEHFYSQDHIFEITAPGHLEGGDVMEVDGTYYVGLSARTNREGFEQFKAIAAQFNHPALAVPVHDFLHLKTGTTYLGDGKLLVTGEFVNHPTFANFTQLVVPAEEAYAVNCINTGNGIIMPAGFPVVKQLLEDHGFPVFEAAMSEFEKIDGGLTCLSLRFTAH